VARWPPSLLLLLSVAGAALVVDSVLRGGSTFALVLIVPVITGSSPELLAGVALIFAGFLAWALASAPSDASPLPTAPPSYDPARRESPDDAGAVGGVLLIGPIPIFLGGYRPGTRRARWAWVALGLGLSVGLWAVIAAAIYLR
jgi:uncharacterized membrane protein